MTEASWKIAVRVLYQDGQSKPLRDEEILDVFSIALSMKTKGVPLDLIRTVALTAINDENPAVFALMKIWVDQKNDRSRNEVLAELKKLLKRAAEPKRIEISFSDREAIKKHIKPFKDQLKAYIQDKGGGIRAVSKRARMNEASLSRFFKFYSVPESETLQKLSRALGINSLSITLE